MDLYGVIGWPIEHSLSPAMQNAAFEALGIDAKYERIPVRPEDLEDFLLNDTKYKGFNITIPHKVRAREILDKHFPLDEKGFANWYYVHVTGAVNTVKRDGNKIEYINTDVEGFVRSLERNLKFSLGEGTNKDKNVLLIGCGGAGRAVIAGLSWDFVATDIQKIYIYDKNQEAVSLLKRHFSNLDKDWTDNLKNITEIISESEISKVIAKCQLLVNASPVGMREGDNSFVIDKELLHKGLSVYDVVYNRETRLVKDAKEKGCAVVGGDGMLYYQGLSAFQFWFPDTKPLPTTTMRDALNKALNL